MASLVETRGMKKALFAASISEGSDETARVAVSSESSLFVQVHDDSRKRNSKHYLTNTLDSYIYHDTC